MIPVLVNHAGPFDFMVDTGSQVTVVDPSLASELHLKRQGSVGLISSSNFVQASASALDTIEAASHIVEKPFVIVHDLGPIKAADPHIRGVRGENFLAHFDLLIDYQHKLLCLDDTKALSENVRGERTPLVRPLHPENEVPFTESLVISVRLSETGGRRILLQLDSGSDGAILYAHTRENALPLLKRATLQGGDASNAQQAFAVLPPQAVRIGLFTLAGVFFVTPVNAAKDIPKQDEDGLLPTLLFQRVFISAAEHYVVFNPK